MLTSIRQNPAIRTLPRWLAISSVTAALLMNYIVVQRQALEPSMLMGVAWLAFAIWLVFGEVRTRCTPFDMALPIPSRKLWLSHLIAVLVSGVAIVTVTAGLFSGLVWLLWKLTGKSFVATPGLGGLAAHMCTGLILAVVLLQNPYPVDHRLHRTRERVVLEVLVVVAVFALVVILSRVSAWTSLATLALAVTVGLHRYRTVPSAFRLSVSYDVGAAGVPVGRDETAAQWVEVASAAPRSAISFARLLDRTIWRSFFVGVRKKRAPWLTIPFLVLFGALMSGIMGFWLDFSLRMQLIPLTVYMLVAFSAYPFKTLHLLDALPVSRRRIMNTLVVPYMVALLAGYGGGAALAGVLERVKPPTVEVIHLIRGRDDGNYYLYVPYEALRVLRGGEPPETVAPWGEAHPAWSRPLWRGASIKVYSPYHTPAGSSIDYTAWQISRAIQAVYGESVSPDEIKDRYLEPRADGSARLRGNALTIQKDFPDFRRDTSSGPVFPVIFAWVFILWMLSLAVYLQAFRAGVSKTVRNVTAGVLMGLMMLWWLTEFIAPMLHLVETQMVDAVFMNWLRRVGESAAATAAVWIAAIALSAAAYWLALNRYRCADAPYERQTEGTG
jgi:hypothetical protein